VKFRLQRFALVLVAAVVLGAGAAQATAASTHRAAPVAIAKTCGRGYVHAKLSWGEKCLRAGQFCKVGNREYRRYGFTCPASGHLVRRR
jgi:hypothetical protein